MKSESRLTGIMRAHQVSCELQSGDQLFHEKPPKSEETYVARVICINTILDRGVFIFFQIPEVNVEQICSSVMIIFPVMIRIDSDSMKEIDECLLSPFVTFGIS